MMRGCWNISIQMILKDWRRWVQVARIISCVQKFLRWYFNLAPDEDLSDVAALKEKLLPLFEAYRKMYADYYNNVQTS